MKSWKQEAKEIVQNYGYKVEGLATLPDCKTLYTTARHIGFCGTISAPTWKALYKKIEEQIEG